MPIARCTHAVFGASKVAADVTCGSTAGVSTCQLSVCAMGASHARGRRCPAARFSRIPHEVRSHRCPYTIGGYKGRQVCDNIHVHEIVCALQSFHANPRVAAIYNLGGGRESTVPMLEAIDLCQ